MVDPSPYILPSNAPPLSGVDHNYIVAQGTLEAHSYDRQIDIPNCEDLDYFEYNEQSLSEDSYTHRQHENGRFAHNTNDHEDDDIWAEREAAQLLQRMQRSERYRNYRAKQPKKGSKAKSDQKWPDELEFALWKALCKHKPMGKGRKQTTLKSKMRGRNELIAESLQKWTGENRCRKQISSHIQVLRPMVEHDPYILQYFPKKARSKSSKGKSNRSYSSQSSSTTSRTRGLSTPSPKPVRRLLSPANFESDYSACPTLIPHKFSMFVCEPGKHALPQTRIHTFAEFNSQNRLPDISLEDLKHFGDRFPVLRTLSEEDALSLQIVFVEGSLQLMEGTTPGAELGIEFEFYGLDDLTVHNGAPCNTYFYDDGILAERGFVAGKITCKDMWLTAPFGSQFWAQKVTTLGAVLREAARTRRLEFDDETRAATTKETALRYDERVSKELLRLSAMQEIFTLHSGSNQPRKTLLIFWTFHRRVSGDKTETNWRNVCTRPSVTLTQHRNNSFNAMSAITLGADPTDGFLQAAGPNVFRPEAGTVAMPLSSTMKDRSVGEPKDEELDDRSCVGFASGSNDILIDSFQEVGTEHYHNQDITHTHPPAYSTSESYAILNGAYDPELANSYGEVGVATFANHQTCSGPCGDMDMQFGHMDLQHAPFEARVGYNYALDSLVAPTPYQWSKYPFLDPGVYMDRSYGEDSTQSQIEPQPVGSGGLALALADFVLDESMSLQEKPCVLSGL